MVFCSRKYSQHSSYEGFLGLNLPSPLLPNPSLCKFQSWYTLSFTKVKLLGFPITLLGVSMEFFGQRHTGCFCWCILAQSSCRPITFTLITTQLTTSTQVSPNVWLPVTAKGFFIYSLPTHCIFHSVMQCNNFLVCFFCITSLMMLKLLICNPQLVQGTSAPGTKVPH